MKRLSATRFFSTRNRQPASLLRADWAAPLGYRALEPRIAFDAAMAATAAETLAEPAPAGAADAAPDTAAPPAAADIEAMAAAIGDVAGEPAPSRTTIVFIDARVGDAAGLMAAAPADASIVVLDAARDGLGQIADHLAGRAGIAAIHIIGHGEAGRLALGADDVTLASMRSTDAASLAAIGRALAADGDILVYGCDVAAGPAGRAFVEALAAATGADVTASIDATGAATHGGDWELEASTGAIEARTIAAPAWAGLLSAAPPVVDLDTSDNPASPRATGNATAGQLGPNNPIGGFNATDSNATGTFHVSTVTGTGFDEGVTILADGNGVSVTLHDADASSDGSAGAADTFVIVLDAAADNNSALDGIVLSHGVAGAGPENAKDMTLTWSGGNATVFDPDGQLLLVGAGGITTAADGATIASGAVVRTQGPALGGAASTWSIFVPTASLRVAATAIDRPDGAGTSNDLLDETLTFNVVLRELGHAGTFVEGGAAVPIASASVVIADDGQITGAEARFVTQSTGDRLVVDVAALPAGISVDPASTTSRIVLAGSASAADYQQALRAIAFETVGDHPDIETVRNVEILVTDDAANTSRITNTLIDVLPDNDHDGIIDGDDIDDDNDGILDATENAPIVIDLAPVPAKSTTELIVLEDGTGKYRLEITKGDNPHLVSFNPATGRIGNSGFGIVGEVVSLHYSTANSPIPFSLEIVQFNQINSMSTTSVRDSYAASVAGTWEPVDTPAAAVVAVDAGDTSSFDGDGLAIGAVVRDDADWVGASGTVPAQVRSFDQLIAADAGATGDGDGVVSHVLTNFGGTTEGHVARLLLDDPQASFQLYVFDAGMSGMAWNYVPTTSITILPDSDGDGISDGHDIDSDNDGILDIVEAQGTTAFVAPSGPVGGGFLDANGDGLDDRFDASQAGAAPGFTGQGLIPVDSDGDGEGDWRDFDSDDDGLGDIDEAGHASTVRGADSDNDGLLDVFEGADAHDGFVVDEGITDPLASRLPDADGDAAAGIPLAADLDYRDARHDNTPPVIDLNDDATTPDRDFAVVFTEGGPPRPVANGAADVIDADDNVTRLAIAVAGSLDGSSEVLTVAGRPLPLDADATFLGLAVGGSSLDIVYTSATGSLVVTNAAGAGVAIAQADLDLLLRGITYANTDQAPTPGNRSLTFTVTDAGGSTSGPAVATITVVPTPDAVGDNLVVSEDAPATPVAPLANDDLGAGTDGIADLAIVTAPTAAQGVLTYVRDGTGATLAAADGTTLSASEAATLAFTPAANFHGPVTIPYTLTDRNGATSAAVIAITVVPTPDAANDSLVVSEDAPATPVAPLANDDLGAGTDGSADLAIGTAPTAAQGVLTYVQDGTGATLAAADGTTLSATEAATLAFTPAANFHGPVTIPYTLTDRNGATSAAVIAIAIVPTPDAANDSLVVSEDAPATPVAPLANDDLGAGTDGIADLAIVTAPTAAQGVLTYVRDGTGATLAAADGTTLSASEAATLAFTPAANFHGPVTIPYTLTDRNGATSAAVIAITVVAVDDPVQIVDPGDPTTDPQDPAYVPGDPNAPGYDPRNPTGIADPANLIPDVTSTDGASPAPIPAGRYFGDVEGDPLVFSATGLPPGLGIDAATGLIQGTLAADASQGGTPGDPAGTYTVLVTATDPAGNTATTTVTYTIANLPPLARNDSGTASEDGPPITGNAIADPATGDADQAPDGDALSVVAVNGDPGLVGEAVRGSTGGTFMLGADGSWRFDPGADFHGLAAGEARATSLAYRVADGQGGTATATVTVTVTGANDAPVALGSIAPLTFTDGLPIDAVETAALFDNPNGLPLVYTASGLPTGLAIDPLTGRIGGTPAADASLTGPYTATVTASGPDGLAASVPVLITVRNPAPAAAADQVATPRDTAVVIAPLANDRDPDGDPLVLSGITQPANGTATLDRAGTVTYVPRPGFTGTDTFTYAVADGQGGTASASITVRVGLPPLDGPQVAGSLPAQTGTDGSPIAPIDAGILFSDPDGGPLAFAATGLPPGLAIDPASGVIGGTLQPDASLAGPYLVTVTGIDPDGNQASTDFLLAVLNPAPLAGADAAATAADTPVVISVLGNDRDPDGDSLRVSHVTPPANGTVSIGADGTLTYAPAAGFVGTDAFTYTVADGEGGTARATVTVAVGTPLPGAPAPTGPLPATAGGTDGAPIRPIDLGALIADPTGQPLRFAATGLPDGLAIDPVSGVIAGRLEPGASAAGPYRITVAAVDPDGNQLVTTLVLTTANPGPDAARDVAATPAGQPVLIGVLANDSDPDGDPLRVLATTAPAHGTATIGAGGSISYRPHDGFTGTDTFTYTVVDADGAIATATVTVRVGIPAGLGSASAVAPVSGIDGGEIAPVRVGAAFGDLDLRGPLTLAVDPATLPPGILFDPATGTLHGRAAADASQGSTPGAPAGTWVVAVTATDAGGARATSYVTFTFVNPPPAAIDDVAASDQGQAIAIRVLANDYDRDGDPLRVVAAAAANGTVVINADGTLTYLPRSDFEGTDVIMYRIGDGQGGFATAFVRVRVVQDLVFMPEAPPAPAAVAPVTHEGLSVDGAVLAAVATIRSGEEGSGEASGPLGRAGGLEVTGLTSFSLRLAGAGADGRTVIETFVRGRTLIVNLGLEAGLSQAPVEWKVQRADGRPAPDWLGFVGRASLFGERPADEEWIDLRVTAVMADGTLVTNEVRIHTSTGELQPLRIGRGGSLAPPMLWDQLRVAPHLEPDAIRALAAAIRVTAAE